MGWESIDSTTERLKVYNGWLVHRLIKCICKECFQGVFPRKP